MGKYFGSYLVINSTATFLVKIHHFLEVLIFHKTLENFHQN